MKSCWGVGIVVGSIVVGAALVVACVGDDPASAPGGSQDAGGGDTGAACTSECTESATQCASGQVQQCQKGADGCLRWSTPAACPGDQICCTNACAPVDGDHCYACNAACSGQTPRCLPTPKKCGCSVAVCAATSQGCSPQTGACEACSALAAGAADIYVDSTSFGAASGTEACPLKTISAAIAKANASSASAVTIHVAAGTYDAAHGETFPFVLRSKSISIVGEGADKTTIQGAGAVDHSAAGGQFNGNSYQVTVLLGDETATYTLSKLTVRAPNDAPTAGYIGVFCDMGNTPTPITNPPIGFPVANTVLDGVTVGPGYHNAIVASSTTSPLKKGCNLSMTNSSVTDVFEGIWAIGGGLSASPGVNVGMSVTKSTFKNVKRPDNNGPAIEAWDGASRVIASDNTIDACNAGISTVNHARADVAIPVAPYYEVERNKITNSTNYGVAFSISMVVEKFNDNTITGTTVANGVGYRGVGLILDSGNAAGGFIPIVKQARRNTIVGNDVGIEMRGGNGLVTQTDGLRSNFGTAADPGLNVIACNSTLSGNTLVGYDLKVTVTGTGAEPFMAGNAWDHAAPTSLTAASGTNGLDVILEQTGSPPSFDLSGATVKSIACPTGRVP